MSGEVDSLLRKQKNVLKELNLSKHESSSMFAYFSFKAAKFLVIGAELYRKQDFFHYPLEEWDGEKLELGCRQIIEECAGLSTPETCFEGLSETDVLNLFELFHFTIDGETDFLDNDVRKIVVRHKMDGMAHTVYYKI